MGLVGGVYANIVGKNIEGPYRLFPAGLASTNNTVTDFVYCFGAKSVYFVIKSETTTTNTVTGVNVRGRVKNSSPLQTSVLDLGVALSNPTAAVVSSGCIVACTPILTSNATAVKSERIMAHEMGIQWTQSSTAADTYVDAYVVWN